MVVLFDTMWNRLKKRKKGLSRALIGEGVNIDEEQDWAQNTALIFHWEKGRGEDFN